MREVTVEPLTQSITQGGTASITIHPKEGYGVEKVATSDGVDLSSKLSETKATLKLQHVNEDIDVVVKFKEVDVLYDVTAEVVNNSGGTISPAETKVSKTKSADFHIYPDKGMRLKSLMLTRDGGKNWDDVTKSVSGGVYTLRDVTSACTLSAEFEEDSTKVPEDVIYTVTPSVKGEGGSISPSTPTYVKAGDYQTFTFLADKTHAVGTVNVDGNPVIVNGSSFTVGPVAKNMEIVVEFVDADEHTPITPHEIEASAGPGGTISPSGTVKVVDKGSMPFTFIPNSGYELSQVLVDGENDTAAVEAGTYRFDDVTKGHTIRAEFTKQQTTPVERDYYNLTVTATSEQGASGTTSPTGTTQVANGAVQTVYFYPAEGSIVGDVTVAEGDKEPVSHYNDLVDGVKLTLDAMKSDVTIAVTFRLLKSDEQTPDTNPHKLTSKVEGKGGSISPAGVVEVADGGSFTYTVTAESGYQLHSVTANNNKNVKVGAPKWQ